MAVKSVPRLCYDIERLINLLSTKQERERSLFNEEKNTTIKGVKINFNQNHNKERVLEHYFSSKTISLSLVLSMNPHLISLLQKRWDQFCTPIS